MHVHEATLVTSAVNPSTYPQDEMIEIALAGRSNVGKSSFINRMINRKNLARTSSQPGKTQTLNFYNINNKFRFVDVPGYGYARVSHVERDKWASMINTYMEERENLRLLFLLMDARHEPSNLDQQMYQYAEGLEIPFAIVMTKFDKVKPNQREGKLQQFKKILKLPSTDALFPFSSETGEGSEEIWEIIESFLDY